MRLSSQVVQFIRYHRIFLVGASGTIKEYTNRVTSNYLEKWSSRAGLSNVWFPTPGNTILQGHS